MSDCDCDPIGSLEGGLCDNRDDPAADLVSGRCHCKENVQGRRCDSCKPGFWDFSADNYQGCKRVFNFCLFLFNYI